MSLQNDIEALEGLQERGADITVWRLRNLVLSMYETIKNHEYELNRHYNNINDLADSVNKLENTIGDLQNNDSH